MVASAVQHDPNLSGVGALLQLRAAICGQRAIDQLPGMSGRFDPPIRGIFSAAEC